jgi:2-C-methyl-D-erythritol 4-phosphate cytidylyltransferase
MKKTVVIFGVRSGIGAAVREQFLDAGHTVIPINSAQIDFTRADSDQEIATILNCQPDIVVNCAGHFADNTELHSKTMDINFGSNWSIVRYYVENTNTKPVSIVFVGSSAYSAGKKNYMLYSASKAALHNLWEGAKEFFGNRDITVNIVHPVRTRTRMVAPYNPNLDYLDPVVVAQMIVEVSQTPTSDCRELSFEEHL